MSWCAGIVAVLVGGVASPAVAAPVTSAQDNENALRWHPMWPRFRTVEFVATGTMLAGTAALALADRYRVPVWQGGILFDDGVRSALGAETADGRHRAQAIGTDLYLGSFGFSVADAVLGAWVARGSSDVMAQMLLIDTEVYALVGLLQFTASAAVRRERPYQRECREGIDVGFPGCSVDNVDGSKGFFAGHTAIAFANAGLTCAHHRHLELYGPVGDTLACGLTTASAFVVAYTRIAADKHYATDNIVGALIGASAGYLVPSLLHYRTASAVTTAPHSVRVAGVVPSVSASYLGLAVAGEF